MLRGGYLFFPEFGLREIEGKDFRDLYAELSSPLYIQFPERYPKEFQRAIEAFSQEYKIHLMVKPEYTPFVIERLFEALRSDPDFAKVVAQVKVINDPYKERDETMPSIVLYTQLGRANAQRALDKVSAYLGRYAGVGLGQTPRFNRKVNDLIYYAQGGGDWKNDYLRARHGVEGDPAARDEDPVFEPDLIHFKGHDPLEIHRPTEGPLDLEGPGAESGEGPGNPDLSVERKTKEVPFTFLNPGDRVDVRTQNSQYAFEVLVDPSSGRRGLKALEGSGPLAGTRGWVNSQVLRTGGRLSYGENRSSPILDFTIRRNLRHAVRSLDPEERRMLAEARLRLEAISSERPAPLKDRPEDLPSRPSR